MVVECEWMYFLGVMLNLKDIGVYFGYFCLEVGVVDLLFWVGVVDFILVCLVIGGR